MSSTDNSLSTAASNGGSGNSAGAHPDGFVLSHLCRDFFKSYYEHAHGRSLSDAEILTRVNAAHDQAVAKAHPYRCIKEYQFSFPRVMLHPHYQQLVQHNAKVGEVRLLDVGSCMGSDLRQMIMHGVRPANALGLELEQDLIDIGLDTLYEDRSTLQTSFCTQNVLDDAFMSNGQLAAFHGAGIDVVYCGSVYHLLDEAATHTLSKHLYKLLAPGGVLFGRTVGSLHDTAPAVANWESKPRFLHSADTFKRMLLQYGFVDVEFVPTATDMGEHNPNKVSRDGFNFEQHNSGMHAFYARKAHT